MDKFNNILFPVDFSPQAAAAVPYVLEMAAVHQAQVTLYHAAWPPLPWYPSDGGVPVIDFNPGEMVALAGEQLEKFKERHFRGTSAGVIVEPGEPAAAIDAFAAERQIDLIMMPTHGCGFFRRLLLGSVTAKVLHDTHCAVWTGVHVEEEPPDGHKPISSMVCAIDLEPETPQLVRKAMELAEQHHATLHLVHCMPSAEAHLDKYFRAEFEPRLIAAVQEEIKALDQKLGKQFEVHLQAGVVPKVVRQGALHFGADLLVVARGVLQHKLGRLRTNTYSIIRDAPCPVISF